MTSGVPKFIPLLRDAWALFRARWSGLVVLTILPLAPLILLLPFLAHLNIAEKTGAVAQPGFAFSPLLTLLALVALILAGVVSVATFAAMFIYLAMPSVRTWQAALRLAWRQWFPFVWTQILASVFIALGLVLLRILYVNLQSWGGPAIVLAAIVGIAVTVVGIVLAVWFTFAGLLAAIGAASGFRALRGSMEIVHGRFWPVLGLLLAWMVIDVIASRIVAPLPIANWVVPAFLTMFGTAYLVALYQRLARR